LFFSKGIPSFFRRVIFFWMGLPVVCPIKPPIVPSDAMTLWQGIMGGSGFFLSAFPIAR